MPAAQTVAPLHSDARVFARTQYASVRAVYEQNEFGPTPSESTFKNYYALVKPLLEYEFLGDTDPRDSADSDSADERSAGSFDSLVGVVNSSIVNYRQATARHDDAATAAAAAAAAAACENLTNFFTTEAGLSPRANWMGLPATRPLAALPHALESPTFHAASPDELLSGDVLHGMHVGRFVTESTPAECISLLDVKGADEQNSHSAGSPLDLFLLSELNALDGCSESRSDGNVLQSARARSSASSKIPRLDPRQDGEPGATMGADGNHDVVEPRSLESPMPTLPHPKKLDFVDSGGVIGSGSKIGGSDSGGTMATASTAPPRQCEAFQLCLAANTERIIKVCDVFQVSFKDQETWKSLTTSRCKSVQLYGLDGHGQQAGEAGKFQLSAYNARAFLLLCGGQPAAAAVYTMARSKGGPTCTLLLFAVKPKFECAQQLLKLGPVWTLSSGCLYDPHTAALASRCSRQATWLWPPHALRYPCRCESDVELLHRNGAHQQGV